MFQSTTTSATAVRAQTSNMHPMRQTFFWPSGGSSGAGNGVDASNARFATLRKNLNLPQ